MGKRTHAMNSDDALPLPLEQKVDEVCTRFEAAWKVGARPRIEDFLAGLGEVEMHDVLRELILLDDYYRRQRGEACGFEDYRARFPQLETAWLAQSLARNAAAIPTAAAFPDAGS